MKDLFLQIVSMSFTASIAIIGVLILRLFLRKAPKAFSCGLWAIVLFRLVCPVSFTSRIALIPQTLDSSMWETLVVAKSAAADPRAANLPAILASVAGTAGNAAGNLAGNVTGNATAGAAASIVDLAGAASLVWIAGILLILFFAILSSVRWKRTLSTATILCDNIYETDRIGTPFVFGLIRPRIFLMAGMPQEEREFVLLHEQAHIRRFDHLIKPFAFLIAAIYWFHPLVWLSYLLLSRDMEMACDEYVMRKTGLEKAQKQRYSQLLLSLSTRQGAPAGLLSFGQIAIRKRIQNILNYKKPTLWITAGIGLLAVAAAILLLGNPAAQPGRTEAELFLRTYYTTDDQALIGRMTSTADSSEARAALKAKYGAVLTGLAIDNMVESGTAVRFSETYTAEDFLSDYLEDNPMIVAMDGFSSEEFLRDIKDAQGLAIDSVLLFDRNASVKCLDIRLTKGPVGIRGDFAYSYEVRYSIQSFENSSVEYIAKGQLLMTKESGEWKISAIYEHANWKSVV